MDAGTMLTGIAIGIVLTLLAIYIFAKRMARQDRRLVEEQARSLKLERESAYNRGREAEYVRWQQERDIFNQRLYESQVEIDRLRRQLNDESIFANALVTRGRATVQAKKTTAVEVQ